MLVPRLAVAVNVIMGKRNEGTMGKGESCGCGHGVKQPSPYPLPEGEGKGALDVQFLQFFFWQGQLVVAVHTNVAFDDVTRDFLRFFQRVHLVSPALVNV